jgi:hypothetical protein
MRSRTTALAFVCTALLLGSAPSNAQVLIGYLFGEKLASPTFNMGFEVGVNFSDLDGFADSERLDRPVFGLFADWRFSENLHFGGAVLPIAGRGADRLAPVTTGDPAFDGQTIGAVMERNVSYVEIPLLLKWAPHREEGLRIGAGPSFGIVTGGVDRYDTISPSGMHYVLERDIGDPLPGLDMGFSMDIEWRFAMLSIAARYTHGLTDMRLEGSPDEIHSRVLTGTGRIYLGKKPS